MLKGRTLGVVVGNYSPELEKLRKLPRIYFAEARMPKVSWKVSSTTIFWIKSSFPMTSSNDKSEAVDLSFEAELTLKRLQPRLVEFWEVARRSSRRGGDFERRLGQHWPRLFGLLLKLYGDRYDFFYHVEQILLTCAEGWQQSARACFANSTHTASTSPTGFNPRASSAARCTSICSVRTWGGCVS